MRNGKAIQGGDRDETGQGQKPETPAAKNKDGNGRSGGADLLGHADIGSEAI
jgi:hypothetical protein